MLALEFVQDNEVAILDMTAFDGLSEAKGRANSSRNSNEGSNGAIVLLSLMNVCLN